MNKLIVRLLDRILRRINFFFCLLESLHIGLKKKRQGKKGKFTQINAFSEYFFYALHYPNAIVGGFPLSRNVYALRARSTFTFTRDLSYIAFTYLFT